MDRESGPIRQCAARAVELRRMHVGMGIASFAKARTARPRSQKLTRRRFTWRWHWLASKALATFYACAFLHFNCSSLVIPSGMSASVTPSVPTVGAAAFAAKAWTGWTFASVVSPASASVRPPAAAAGAFAPPLCTCSCRGGRLWRFGVGSRSIRAALATDGAGHLLRLFHACFEGADSCIALTVPRE